MGLSVLSSGIAVGRTKDRPAGRERHAADDEVLHVYDDSKDFKAHGPPVSTLW